MDLDLTKPIVYRVAGMDRASVRRELVYRRDGEDALGMDVYAPADLGRDARRPAVLYVHGGPVPAEMTPPTQWGIFTSHGQLAAASGLIGVVFRHRLHAPTDYSRSEQDVRAAVDYVRAHADELQIDPERLALWAFSGGGPQLTWILRDPPPYVRALVFFYALLDLRHAIPADADEQLRAGVHAFSPAAWVERAPELPLLVARAGRDNALFNQGIDRFVQAALAANANLTLANHRHGQHSFDLLDDDARSHELIAQAIAFLQQHLR
jgi:acetyl esterase/lipase